MGNLASSGLGGGITRQQLLNSTRDNREFTNKIFGAMISKLTPIDILELSDSGKCSKYIFLMAQSFNKIFDDLKIRPERDSKSGLVYYKKVDELVNPKGAAATEKLILCREIAYFNIRLFQIFGALALSIIDDNSAGAVLGSYSEAMRKEMYMLEQKEPTHGFWGQPKARPGSKPIIIGGAVDDNAFPSRWPEFKNLKNILDPVGSITADEKTINNALLFTGSEIYLYFDNKDGISTPYLYFNKDNNSYYCKIQIQVQSSRAIIRRDLDYRYRNEHRYNIDTDDTKLKIILTSFYYYNNILSETAYRRINNILKTTNLTFEIQSSDNKISWYSTSDRRDFVIALKHNLVDTIKKIVIKDEEGKTLFGSEYEKAAYAGYDGLGKTFSESSSSEQILKTKYIIDTIQGIAKGDKVSFCIARALQLIDARSTFMPKPNIVTSSVCKSKLDSLPTSIPTSKLTDVPGLKSLDQLYYKPTPSISEKIVYNTDSSYIEFLTKMSESFNPSGTMIPKTLDGIAVKNPTVICAAAANKYLFIKDPKKINEIMSYVNSLFKIQLNHTKNVLDFFKSKLFLIKKTSKGTTIDIHPSLLTGDFNELEKVSKDARKLLVDYYSGCEKKYQDGLKVVLTESSTYKITPDGTQLGK